MLENIHVVLSHTTHPGNVGAAARAMKVMGLSRLKLVNPQKYPSAQATERASRATDILANAETFDDIEKALADCQLVVGTSARTRSLPSKLITPRELISVIEADPQRAPVALLFGTENSGLTNEELHLCHYHVCIPTNPEYSSLNLASAVQLLAYELYLTFGDRQPVAASPRSDGEQPINREQMSGILQHFDEVMRMTGYLLPAHEKQIDIRMNRLLNKADITLSEMNILRGFLRAIENHCGRLENKGTLD
jgi:TrmH family RNA methyltransferase